MRWLDGITNLMDMSEQALGDGEGQGSLACCTPWGHKDSVMTERVNNMKLIDQNGTSHHVYDIPALRSLSLNF